MASNSFAGRHPVVTVLLVLMALLALGSGYAYCHTDKGKALLPTLEKPTLNISNITREKITGQMVVQRRNNSPITLKIDSLRYETLVDGKRLAQGRKDRPLVVEKNATNRLELPISMNLPALKQEAKTAQRA